MYRKLDPDKIVATVRTLRTRIEERFPNSGLARVAAELDHVTSTSAQRAAWIAQRNYLLRGLAGFLIVVFGLVLVWVIRQVRISSQVDRITELLQGVDAALNTLILLGGGSFFLLSLERRVKRGRALKAVHELRSLAHVVDMHQLTKDPELLLSGEAVRTGQVRRPMTRAELARYLSFCSEMLSLISKVAALHVQKYSDPVVLSAVDQIEDLTTSLSNKIWQKIMILEQTAARAAGTPQAGAAGSGEREAGV